MSRLVLATIGLLFTTLGHGCRATDPPGSAIRLVAPPRGSASTAALARASIGGETRLVLSASRPVVIRSREEVHLPDAGDLDLEVALPESVANASEVRLDAWLSARDPSLADTLSGRLTARRITVHAAPVMLQRGAVPLTSAVLVQPVPEALHGLTGLVTVMARPLSASPIEHREGGPFRVLASSRLVFGYGVEEPGWVPGWPPVRFQVRATDVANDASTVLFDRRIDPVTRPRDRRWFDASVDLTPLAGRQVRLVFEAEALGDAPEATVARSFPVISNPEIVPPQASLSEPRRNVILISLDTLRARNVSAYGYGRLTTPKLDQRVAAAGALVKSAVSPIPFTPPAHMSMLTGLEPCAHAVIEWRDVLAPERVTLAEELRAAGYQTAAFTEDAYLVTGAGFERGFDTYVENRSEESLSPGFAAETFDAAGGWLATHGGRPFFLFVHTYQVHEPYAPPRPYGVLFPNPDETDEHRRELDNYDREIRYTDDVLADFLDRLDAGGLGARTIVIVTSDHGEGFGEHSWSRHGLDLHDEALLVPFLIRAPGLIPPGTVVEEQVGLTDLTPTVLDLVGLRPPSDIQGRSFGSLLTGHGAHYDERPLRSITIPQFLLSDSIRTRRYKYIKTAGSELLYDLGRDPLEKDPHATEDDPELRAARGAFDAAKAECARWQQAHPSGTAVALGLDSASDPMVNVAEFADEIRRKLHSLGYVQ